MQTVVAALLAAAAVLGAGSARGSPTGAAGAAYMVTSRVDPEPILAFRGFGVGNADWQQVFNPTWVEPTAATGNRSGLLARSQNCTPPASAPAGSCGPTCAGTGQMASWLTWAELSDDGGADARPAIVNRVGESDAVWGPFDCPHWTPGGKGTPSAGCIDERGTEDPRLTYDRET